MNTPFFLYMEHRLFSKIDFNESLISHNWVTEVIFFAVDTKICQILII